MKYAWIEDGKVREVAAGDPAGLYHPDVAKFFCVEVPDEAVSGDLWDGARLSKAAAAAPKETAAKKAAKKIAVKKKHR